MVSLLNYSKLKQCFYFLLYADDTTLFCNLEDFNSNNKEFTLNQELQQIH